jgi:hypothetical protein
MESNLRKKREEKRRQLEKGKGIFHFNQTHHDNSSKTVSEDEVKCHRGDGTYCECCERAVNHSTAVRRTKRKLSPIAKSRSSEEIGLRAEHKFKSAKKPKVAQIKSMAQMLWQYSGNS